MLKIGSKAPDFTLPSTSGNDFNLYRDTNNEAVILYFYPKDNTRICTAEACQFRDNFELLRNLSVKVVGISTDTLETHLRFKDRHNLPFELLSDKTGKVSKLYKAHIPFLNLSKRVTYLLNADHKIIEAVNDLFSADKHFNKMIKNIDRLKK